MKEIQDADTIIRELFNKALSAAKQQAEHETSLYKSFLSIDNLGVNARIILFREELSKLISEIQSFERPEYIYNFRNETNLYNLFYNRLVFLEVNESQFIINAYEIALKQAFLLTEYNLILKKLPKYSFNDFLESKENVFLFKFNERPKNIDECEFEQIRIWQTNELIKAIELEKQYFQEQFRKIAAKTTNLQELIKLERSFFDNLMSFDNDTNFAYYAENLQYITPLKSINYTFNNPQKIKVDFLNFFADKIDYELITPANIQNIQQLYNQKKPKNPISEPPFLFWSLFKYDDWLDEIQKGTIKIDEDNFTDYNIIFQSTIEKATETAQKNIANYIKTYRYNDRYNKEYSEVVLTLLEQSHFALNSLKDTVYFNLLDKPDLLRAVFIQNCYLSASPEHHINTLENSIILDEEIEFLHSEMSIFIENQYFKMPENQQLAIHLEILGLINSITINTVLYKNVFAALQQFLKDSGTTRKPFYFCLLDLKDNLFKIFDSAIQQLQKAFDLLTHDRKHFYIQNRLKEIKRKELQQQRHNKELGYYVAEFKKVLEIELDYIKGTKDYDFINKFVISDDIQLNNQKISFQYIGKDLKPLEFLYTSLNLKIGFINDLKTTKTDFLEVLTTKDLTKIKKEIHLGCETTQFAYIIKLMEDLFNNFNPKTIEISGLFFSRKGTKILAQNLYSNNKGNPKEIDTINKVFKEMK